MELYVVGQTPREAIEDGIAYEPYEGRLSALHESVRLLGVMSHDEVLRILPDFDIGLALYKPYPNNLSRWADPSRVKDYLACGLAVIITDVPEIAKDINRYEAGLVIPYTADALVEAIAALYSEPERTMTMRRNARRYMEKFSWSRIFNDAFRRSIAAWEKKMTI